MAKKININEETLLKLYNKGISKTEISNILDVSRNIIKNRLMDLGIENTKGENKDFVNECKKYFNNGKTEEEISNILNLPVYIVRKFIPKEDYIEKRKREFLLRIVKDNNECWIWDGKKDRKNYGIFHFNGKGVFSHRISLLFFKNIVVPDDKVVCHKCDCPACVNPDHLFVGTQKDNVQDAFNKGRLTVGEKNPMAKLKKKEVLNIIKEYNNGITQNELARKYNVTQSNISSIVRNKSWKSIESKKARKGGNFKLNEEIVLKVVNEFVKNNDTMINLSNKYKIKFGTLFDILKGKSWKYLTKDLLNKEKSKMVEQEVNYGEVIWFNEKRGLGFIKCDDGSKDKFVHYSNIVSEPGKFKTLVAGQRVSFTIGSNKNGPQAEQVMVIDEEE